MRGHWMLAFSPEDKRGGGARNEEQARNEGRSGELKPDGGNRTDDGHIYDPGKFMPSSPVSPGTPEQTHARGEEMLMRARSRMGFETSRSEQTEGNEMRGFASPSAHGGGEEGGEGKVEKLTKLVKKLQKRLEHAEGGGEEFAKASGEGLCGEELFKKLPSLGRKALKVLKNPPETWEKYLKEGDAPAIYEMESKELERAVKEAQESGSEKSVDKEITHVCAALLYMLLEDEE